MGYDLSNGNDVFRWNIWSWGSVINLALAYGWKPTGTTMEYEEDCFDSIEDYERFIEEFGGEYFGNNGQAVDAEDAKAMGEALEASLPHLPTRRKKLKSKTLDDEFKAHRKKIYDQELDALHLDFSGRENKKYLKQFISFLNKGEFNIW